MPSLLIVADDLTGAADSAARCNNAGLPASIGVTAPPLPRPGHALAIQTDSRHLPPAEAATRLRSICAGYVQIQDLLWYKKIDSTLRGNIGAELDALLTLIDQADDGAGRHCAVVNPAFPAQRRGLRDGFLVHADTPPFSRHLPSIIEAQTGRTVAHIPLWVVRRGSDELVEQIRLAVDDGATILVVDGESDQDLATIASAGASALARLLLCGSAGLAGALVDTLSLPPRKPRSKLEPSRSILCVVGSGSAVAQAQKRALFASAYLAEEEMPASDGPVGLCSAAPAHVPQVTLLYLPPPQPGTALDGPAARRLAGQLADTALEHFRTQQPDTLILVGGDTAIHTLKRLGVDTLDVRYELLPGMPLTRGTTRDGHPLAVVLKAGNHGEPGTLVELIAALA